MSIDYNELEQPHPCQSSGCEHIVQYDDEPYCFTHSPDGGSSVRGYSWRAVHGITTDEHLDLARRFAAQRSRGLITNQEFIVNMTILVQKACI